MKNRTLFSLLGLACFFFLCAGTAGLAVTDPVESNYAMTAKEMVQSGNWMSPQIFGTYWYDKPIFLYWMISLSYTLFGITDVAARLPGVIAGSASALLLAWYILRRTHDQALSALGAGMTVTTLSFWAISHSIITDSFLFLFSIGIYCFSFIGLTEGKKRYIMAAYVMAALAVLTKGPIGIVLPGTFLIVFALITRNTTYGIRIFQPLGILLFALVCLPWYAGMYALHGMDFINGFLGLHNIARATVSEHPDVNVWYYYVVLVPISLLPWTGTCLYGLVKNRFRNESVIYGLIWAIGTILFYTMVATKYPTYTYIAYIPLILFSVRGIEMLCERNSVRLWTILTGPVIFLWILLFIGAVISARLPVSMGSWLALYLFVPAAVVLVIAAQKWKAAPALPALAIIGTAVIYTIVLFQGLQPFYQYRSAQSYAADVPATGYTLYFFEDYRVSFPYYTGHRAIYTAPAGYDENKQLHRSSIWSEKHPFPQETSAVVVQKLQQRQPPLFLVPEKKYTDFMESGFSAYMTERGKYGSLYLFETRKD